MHLLHISLLRLIATSFICLYQIPEGGCVGMVDCVGVGIAGVCIVGRDTAGVGAADCETAGIDFVGRDTAGVGAVD